MQEKWDCGWNLIEYIFKQVEPLLSPGMQLTNFNGFISLKK